MRISVVFVSIFLIACSRQVYIPVAQVVDIMVPWEGGPAYYSQWSNGPSTSPDYFPIGVWSQDPLNATATTYQKMGINTFVNIPKGPNERDLSALKNIPMTTFCTQNDAALSSTSKSIITGYHLASEPDNVEHGATTPTDSVIARYARLKSKDATRPIYICMGQGVVEDLWYGRGVRTNHPEDYVEYAKGGDILAYDIYPMNIFAPPANSKPYKIDYANATKQMPWRVTDGVDKLRKYSDNKKPVWAWIECTNYSSHPDYALTPEIVKAEVWMALVHGARGIGYFVHIIKPTPVVQAGLLQNAVMSDAVSTINAQIKSLAPVLNTQSVANGITAVSSNKEIPVDIMLKRLNGSTYIFAVSMRGGATTATFTLRDFVGKRKVEVLNEKRTLKSVNGVFKDDFSGYGVHIYKIIK